MSLAQIKSHLWSNKRQLNRSVLYLSILVAAGIFASIRIRPILEGKQITIVFSREKNPTTSNKNKSSPGSTPPDKNPNSNAMSLKSQAPRVALPAKFLIERPLFDGKSVKLQGVLLQGVSSNQQEPEIEVEIISGDRSVPIDDDILRGGKLIGVASPNFDSKRYSLQFSQLVTESGKRYSVAGYAFEDGGSVAGIPADFSSGLTRRLVGAALGRAIQVTEDVIATRALKSAGSESAASGEINRSLFDSGRQAGSSLSQESTKDLTATKPELALKAGTVFWMKLQGTDPSHGGGNE
jgi:hypothetical protein